METSINIKKVVTRGSIYDSFHTRYIYFSLPFKTKGRIIHTIQTYLPYFREHSLDGEYTKRLNKDDIIDGIIDKSLIDVYCQLSISNSSLLFNDEERYKITQNGSSYLLPFKILGRLFPTPQLPKRSYFSVMLARKIVTKENIGGSGNFGFPFWQKNYDEAIKDYIS